MESDAIVLTESGDFERRTVTVDEAGPDQVLLRVELSGVCGSDVHMWRHGLDLDYPVVPGHEFVGIVESVGEGIRTDSAHRPVAEGDALTVVPGIRCGDCWDCENRPARPLTCDDRDVLGFRSVEDPPHRHGGLSEYVLLVERAHFSRASGQAP